jgi:hypothetical protein
MTLCFKKSALLTLATWCFIAASFADFANLDDILPGTNVSHPVEIGGSDETNDEGINSQNLQEVKSLIPLELSLKSPSASCPHSIHIVDVDSPSLAADRAIVDEAVGITPIERNIHFVSHTPALELYLLHCELLI